MRRPYVPAFAANGRLIFFHPHIFVLLVSFPQCTQLSALHTMCFFVLLFLCKARNFHVRLLFPTNYLHLHPVPPGLPHIDCRHITVIHGFGES